MPETLLTSSSVLLFGRLVEDLAIKPSDGTADPHSGAPGHLARQMQAEDPNFARIYGFGLGGIYHVLPFPALFLVHGRGTPAADAIAGLKNPPKEAEARGTEAEPAGLLLPEDLVAWTYDKGDFSIRLDIQTGTLEDLLLGNGPDGPEARGMSAQGMSVQGMSIQGMSVRGMSLRGGKKD